MRILQFHSNFIEYRLVEKEIESAEEAEQETTRIEEIVVLFTCIEEGDTEKTAKMAVDEIHEFLAKIGTYRILIYPFAHLSNELASPRNALTILKSMEQYSKSLGLEVKRAPFGWCKQFTISIKGHPLAEQLRTIVQGEKKEEEVVSQALVAEEKITSHWFIIQPNGAMLPLKEFDFKDHENLKKFADYEISKVRAVQQTPPHVTLMRKLEIADYEPASDSGNFRWYPKGRLIKSLLEQFVTKNVIEYGAMEVETPIMYDLAHPSLASYLHRFPARQYIVKSDDKEFFLRFSACFGQFLMAHDTQFSYRQLPFRIYELTRYSFRREKSGELVGLRRLRGFTMPDCHAMCADLDQVKEEFMKRLDLSVNTLRGFEIEREDYEMAVRFTREFYESNKDFITSLVRKLEKPALAEIWDDRFFYFILKWDLNFVDNLNKASALATDQIDIENAERYGIVYTDENGERKNPLILHCSPSGGIERVVYAILEKAYREQTHGKSPMLPLWLSPVQARIIPVSEQFSDDSRRIAEELVKNEIRADWDDRQLTMQKKIRDAETEWVPYTIVVGKTEVETGSLAVRDRRIPRDGKIAKIRKMTLKDVIDEIRNQTEGKPFKHLSLPIEISRRPRFFG